MAPRDTTEMTTTTTGLARQSRTYASAERDGPGMVLSLCRPYRSVEDVPGGSVAVDTAGMTTRLVVDGED